jgi:transposase
VDGTPLNIPKTNTLLPSIRLYGSAVRTTFQGALNKERFLEYLRDVLAPRPQEGEIVVMWVLNFF